MAVGAEAPSLLAGLIVDADGSRMTPTHATKKVKRYCYYVSASLLAGEGLRVSAGDIEALVLDRLRALLSSRTDVSETLAPLDLDAYALDGALRKVLKLSERWLAMPPVELKSLLQEIVDRITVAADRIEIQLSRAKIAAALQVGERGQRHDLDPVVLSIEAKVRRAGKGKRLVIGNGAETEVNAVLVRRLEMNKCRLTSLVRLSYLGPEIVRALLAGSQSHRRESTATRRTDSDQLRYRARLEMLQNFPFFRHHVFRSGSRANSRLRRFVPNQRPRIDEAPPCSRQFRLA